MPSTVRPAVVLVTAGLMLFKKAPSHLVTRRDWCLCYLRLRSRPSAPRPHSRVLETSGTCVPTS